MKKEIQFTEKKKNVDDEDFPDSIRFTKEGKNLRIKSSINTERRIILDALQTKELKKFL
jgi:hypothetical protein